MKRLIFIFLIGAGFLLSVLLANIMFTGVSLLSPGESRIHTFQAEISPPEPLILEVHTPGNIYIRRSHCVVDSLEGPVLELEFHRITDIPGFNARVKSVLNRSRVLYSAAIIAETLVPARMQRVYSEPDHDCLTDDRFTIRVTNSTDDQSVAYSRMSLRSIHRDFTNEVILNTAPVEGYSDRISVAAGEEIRFYVHTLSENYSVDIIRHGLDDELAAQLDNLPGRVQHYRTRSYRDGADWDVSFTVTIPADWKSGMYSARLYDDEGHEFHITFVVNGGNSGPAGIAVLASTNTWQAYNSWGGASMYRYTIDDGLPVSYSFIVSMHRPNPEATPFGDVGHLANAELHILRWLEAQNHTYHLYSDWDLHHHPAGLASYPVWVISTHSEYWTETMYDALENHLQNGGSLLYLSGNGIFWKTVIKDDRLEVRKDHSMHRFDGTPGGYWIELGRPASTLLGVTYPNPDPAFGTTAPFMVENSSHWIFEGTGLSDGYLVGGTGLNGGGASGYEMDKMDAFSPPNTTLLATGMNPRGGADMVYYDHPAGGGVFSVSSVTFGGSLVLDEHLGKMVNNAILHFVETESFGR